jgi:hypothetical protein
VGGEGGGEAVAAAEAAEERAGEGGGGDGCGDRGGAGGRGGDAVRVEGAQGRRDVPDAEDRARQRVGADLGEQAAERGLLERHGAERDAPEHLAGHADARQAGDALVAQRAAARRRGEQGGEKDAGGAADHGAGADRRRAAELAEVDPVPTGVGDDRGGCAQVRGDVPDAAQLAAVDQPLIPE